MEEESYRGLIFLKSIRVDFLGSIWLEWLLSIFKDSIRAFRLCVWQAAVNI